MGQDWAIVGQFRPDMENNYPCWPDDAQSWPKIGPHGSKFNLNRQVFVELGPKSATFGHPWPNSATCRRCGAKTRLWVGNVRGGLLYTAPYRGDKVRSGRRSDFGRKSALMARISTKNGSSRGGPGNKTRVRRKLRPPRITRAPSRARHACHWGGLWAQPPVH